MPSPTGSCSVRTRRRSRPWIRHGRPSGKRTTFPDFTRCFRLSHRRDCLHGLRRGPAPAPRGRPRLPSLSHATPAGVSEPFPELGGSRQSPGSLSPFRRSSRPEAPSLRRHYPASPVLRASPPPCRPKLALAGSRWTRARHRQGFPGCSCAPLARMPPPLPRRRRPASVRSPPSSVASPVAGSLPRDSGGSASALDVSRPARRSLALRPACLLNRPRRPFSLGVLQSTSLPLSTVPSTTGCYVEYLLVWSWATKPLLHNTFGEVYST